MWKNTVFDEIILHQLQLYNNYFLLLIEVLCNSVLIGLESKVHFVY